MRRLIVAMSVCLALTTASVAAAADKAGVDAKRNHKINTSLRQGVPTENGTWSWHSTLMEKLCESLTVNPSPFGDVACGYWTGHTGRQK